MKGNVMMRNTLPSLIMRLFHLLAPLGALGLALLAAPQTQDRKLETRTYQMPDGQKIIVSSLGHVIGVEGPCGDPKKPCVSDGMVLSWKDPKTKKTVAVYDTFYTHSNALGKSGGDLELVKADWPSSGIKLAPGQSWSMSFQMRSLDNCLDLRKDVEVSAKGVTSTTRTQSRCGLIVYSAGAQQDCKPTEDCPPECRDPLCTDRYAKLARQLFSVKGDSVFRQFR
jgi:hypothetical protein